MNAKEKALVLKEQGQVLRGVSLQTLQEKDASVQQPRKKKNRTQELLHTFKDIACMNQPKSPPPEKKFKWGYFWVILPYINI